MRVSITSLGGAKHFSKQEKPWLWPRLSTWLVVLVLLVFFLSLYFPSVAPPSSPPASSLLLLFSPMPVSHFHAPFQGEGEGKRQINKISFQSLYSQRELDEGAAGRGGVGGLRPAIENCCPYPERSVYTTCKVKQIDPGCRFTCVFVRLPVNLPACHLQSLFSVPDQTSLSLSLSLSFSLHTCVCLCVCVPVFVYRCVYVRMSPVCVSHVGARPGSREALRETSG